MSDTPRADAAEIRHGKEGYSYLTVSVEFARQLERELRRLHADNERLRGLLRDWREWAWSYSANDWRVRINEALQEDKT